MKHVVSCGPALKRMSAWCLARFFVLRLFKATAGVANPKHKGTKSYETTLQYINLNHTIYIIQPGSFNHWGQWGATIMAMFKLLLVPPQIGYPSGSMQRHESNWLPITTLPPFCGITFLSRFDTYTEKAQIFTLYISI